MKAKYQKPMVAVDLYKLSQAIAGCSIKVNYNSSLCYLTDSSVPPALVGYAAEGWFTAEGACVKKAEDGQVFDGFCYHTQGNGVSTS